MAKVSMITLGVLLLAGGIAAARSRPHSPPPPPVAVAAVHWRQFADSCVGIVTTRSALARPVTLELVVTNTAGGVELTPEESFDRITSGQSLTFTLYETACRAVAGWRLVEQSLHLPDPVPPPSQMEY
jgi:hypothetical protein